MISYENVVEKFKPRQGKGGGLRGVSKRYSNSKERKRRYRKKGNLLYNTVFILIAQIRYRLFMEKQVATKYGGTSLKY